jgi:hypothetical protein
MDSRLISIGYKKLLTEKHDKRPWGGTGHSWVPYVLDELSRLCASKNCEIKTILDFGCGRGTFKTKMEEVVPGITIFEYDPGVRGKDELLNAQVDYVVCTDVMEHVEEQFVDETLHVIRDRALYGAFFNIDCNLSKSSLPDGRNTHITVKPPMWWLEKLEHTFSEWRWRVLEKRGRLVVAGEAP